MSTKLASTLSRSKNELRKLTEEEELQDIPGGGEARGTRHDPRGFPVGGLSWPQCRPFLKQDPIGFLVFGDGNLVESFDVQGFGSKSFRFAEQVGFFISQNALAIKSCGHHVAHAVYQLQ